MGDRTMTLRIPGYPNYVFTNVPTDSTERMRYMYHTFGIVLTTDFDRLIKEHEKETTNNGN